MPRESGRPRPSSTPGSSRSIASSRVKVGAVSYASDVARIIQNRCQSCHRPGQVGPFSLLSYDDARKHSAMIREVVEERRMPPWHADPRYGHFVNDRRLSARERATLLAWVDQGTPLGDIKDMPPDRKYPEGWTIGKPDVVFEIPETYYVPAQGAVAYVHFVVPTNFKEDMWIQAAEAVPGDPSVVHHIVVFLLDQSSRGPRRGPGEHFCGYAPGDLPTVLPEGTAKRIPAGANLLIQVHYTPNGRVRSDRSRVGMIFAKTKPTRQSYTIGIANPDLMLPAGARQRGGVLRGRADRRRAAGQLHAAHAPAGQGLQVHGHPARRAAASRPLRAGVRLRLADLLRPFRADGAAQGVADRLRGPLRQLLE